MGEGQYIAFWVRKLDVQYGFNHFDPLDLQSLFYDFLCRVYLS